MNDLAFVHTQREWRRRLLEGERALRWRPARDLAAQLLLYLDDPAACWSLTAAWLREQLNADRVDGGLGGYTVGGTRRDYTVWVECQRPDLELPSVMGTRFAATEQGLLAVWRDRPLLAIAEVSQARQMSGALRHHLQGLGTQAKIAIPLWDHHRPVGLFCADWQHAAPDWNRDVCNELPQLVQDLLGPLLAQVSGTPAWADDVHRTPGDADDWANRPLALQPLTAAEYKVAVLVARGLSYKEIAAQLERSFSTVDHQLRSIRDKLGVRSTARLVRVLAQAL